jgi:hypothetical protein
LHDMGLNAVDAPNVGWDAWIDIRNRI